MWNTFGVSEGRKSKEVYVGHSETKLKSRWSEQVLPYSAIPANDAATTWWLDPTPSRPNGVTTTGGRPPRPHLPHPTHLTSNLLTHLISPFHLGGAQDRCSATLLPIRSHTPVLHGPSPLIFPPLHLPLLHSSFTPRRSAHWEQEWAPTLALSEPPSPRSFSVSFSRRGLSLTHVPSKTHAQSVAIGYTPVGSPFYVWCANSGALPLLRDSFPSRLPAWPRGAAPHAPHRSHLQHPPVLTDRDPVPGPGKFRPFFKWLLSRSR